MNPRTLSAVILAAGKGTRMNSDLPKVAHRVADRAMVEWVVDACEQAGCARIVLVVGHGQDRVRALFRGRPVEFAVQAEQLGTGHAVRAAENLFHVERSQPGHDILVLAGDGPLVRPATLRSLVDRHRAGGASATLATGVIADPTGYGRVVRDSSGGFVGIVEEKHATPAQRAIREVNPSYYCFDARDLFAALPRVPRNPESGEYYLTDVPALLMREGRRVEVFAGVPADEVLSINTPAQLAEAERLLTGRAGGEAVRGGRAA